MSAPDRLAAQVARNVQHMHRLGQLYRVATPDSADAANLRAELVEAASHAGPAAAGLSTAEGCEQYMTRLRGLARLALSLRNAFANSAGADSKRTRLDATSDQGGSHDQK